MTFSIAARCARTGRFGVAISSSSPAVAARCAHVRAGVGAVCSQNITDPRLGPAALDLMALGVSAPAALETLAGSRPNIEHRQLTAVDAAGRTSTFSGSGTLGTWGVAEARDCVAAGNLLADAGVPAAMVAAFEVAQGDLGDRLIAALQAGLAAGGEAGPVHSAGLLMAGEESWPIADLRVDWDDADPIGRLADLWALYRPQMEAYVQRALEPVAAPSYGVPGDE
ncbi:MAG: hypothetical protein K0S00_3383 [Xanthobacteraceae bacterium]|jgi:uncharacterized Ntn-hydrolase superfamily protein|nr:hypothetical protein [Xanthobacteraceae bacterium]